MNNNCIKLPLNSLDIDKFIKVYKNEINIYFDKLDKCKNLETENEKNLNESQKYYNKLNIKDLKEIKILNNIIKERSIIDNVVNRENKSYKVYLKKEGFKIADTNKYKHVKKVNIKKLTKWDQFYNDYSIVKKDGKKYFARMTNLKRHYGKHNKSIHRLLRSNIVYTLKNYKKFKQFSFIPSLVDTVLIEKKDTIRNVLYIFENIEGKSLGEYIKNKSEQDKDALKDKIKLLIKQLHKKDINYSSYTLKNDILITKSGKIYLTGIHNYNREPDKHNLRDLDVAFENKRKNNNWDNNIYVDSENIVLHELIKKGKIKFK
jgi:hypothetical protein